MNCPEVRKIVYLFVDGALDPRANVDVLAHLNMCPPCNERFSDAKKFEDFLKERLKPGIAPDALKHRINSSLAEMASPWPVRAAGSLRRRPIALLAGVAALFAVSFTTWRSMGEFGVCPYVQDATKSLKSAKNGQLQAVPRNPEGATKQLMEVMPFPEIAGLIASNQYIVAMGPHEKDAMGIKYHMPHCADDATCTMLFFVKAPGLNMGEHNCVVRNGRKFCCWEYDGCRIVCWKDEKRGLYAMMVCEKKEMEHEALVNFASIASAQ